VHTRPGIPEPAVPAPRPTSSAWRHCGALSASVGLFASGSGLILLNARAARERILYEDILGGLMQEAVPQQAMLIPPMLELPPLEASLLGDQQDFFSGIGFELEPFGRHLFRIRAVPAWIDPQQAESFIGEMLHRIQDRGIRPEDPQAARSLVARLAANRESRGFSCPGDADWVRLAERLLQCENPLLDARGRPTFVEIRNSEIGRKLMLEGSADSDRLE